MIGRLLLALCALLTGLALAGVFLSLPGCALFGEPNTAQYDTAATACAAKGRYVRARYRTCSPEMIAALDDLVRTDPDCRAVFHGSGVSGRCLDAFPTTAGEIVDGSAEVGQ